MNLIDLTEPKNLILKRLSAPLRQNVEECLEIIEMPLSEVIYRPKTKIEYVYFPDTSVISIVTLLENGDSIESGIIGREGVSGANIAFGDDLSPTEATVQLGGIGRRMNISDFKLFFDKDKEFRDNILYYVYSYIAQISQNSACLSHHIIEKRLARWLLMFEDRRGKDDVLILTQEFIAQMLGVHRPSVSINASKLQKMGLIAYNRGAIKILDRSGLENLACECYCVINESLHGFSSDANDAKFG